jgi:hypothetical protein
MQFRSHQQMFLLGAAKNVGADLLSKSVEDLLDHLKFISGASFLADNATLAKSDSGTNAQLNQVSLG